MSTTTKVKLPSGRPGVRVFAALPATDSSSGADHEPRRLRGDGDGQTPASPASNTLSAAAGVSPALPAGRAQKRKELLRCGIARPPSGSMGPHAMSGRFKRRTHNRQVAPASSWTCLADVAARRTGGRPPQSGACHARTLFVHFARFAAPRTSRGPNASTRAHPSLRPKPRQPSRAQRPQRQTSAPGEFIPQLASARAQAWIGNPRAAANPLGSLGSSTRPFQSRGRSQYGGVLPTVSPTETRVQRSGRPLLGIGLRSVLKARRTPRYLTA
jgi:hypothetical protein